MKLKIRQALAFLLLKQSNMYETAYDKCLTAIFNRGIGDAKHITPFVNEMLP
jgi:hypothetical protein